MNARLAVGMSLLCSLIVGCAVEPVGWRTDGTGRYPHADSPTEWSATENVVWKTPIPAWGNATPVIVGDRIFICAEPDKLICVSRRDGTILWEGSNPFADVVGTEQAEKALEAKKRFDEIKKKKLQPLKKQQSKLSRQLKKSPDDPNTKQKIAALKEQIKQLEVQLKEIAKTAIPETHPTNGYTSSTPVSDGRYACAVFGTGIVACYDLQGERKWIKLLEKPTHERGHSASPLLVGDTLLVHILDLVGLDVNTGKELWRAKSRPHFGSPVHARVDGVDLVVTADGDIVRVADGAILTKRISALEYGSPIVHDGLVYFIEHGGKAGKLPQNTSDRTESQVLWETKPKKDRYYASPVIHDGLIYAITQKRVFSVIDAKTGEIVYEKKLDLGKGTVYPSITLGGKYLFVSIDNGTTVVLKPGREYKELFRNQLGPFRSTPVFIGKRMYVRGLKNLYCIGR